MYNQLRSKRNVFDGFVRLSVTICIVRSSSLQKRMWKLQEIVMAGFETDSANLVHSISVTCQYT